VARCVETTRGCSVDEMPAFVRDGVRLAYREVGEGDVPVVLHTGGAGSGSMWERGGYVPRLRGFRLVLYDHRGRGDSDRPRTLAAHRIEQYVDDVVALADALGSPRYAMVGYSWGAAVGLRLAAQDPRLVCLVALGHPFDPPQSDPASSAYPVDPIDGMAALVDIVEVEEQLTLPDWLRDEFMSTDAEQFALTLEANAGRPDPWALLGRIASPCVLIAGTEEDPDRTQDEMAARILDGHSVHLAGVGHVGAFLRPDEVVAAALPALHRATG
jgi:pimeloyl-ACP methyl ester carboxylesterase